MPATADRVKETSTTTGTGAMTLAGAVSGFRSFSSVFATGTDIYYVIDGGSEWEVGIGNFTTTLARTTIIASSNANAAVNFSAGTKYVFCTFPGSACSRSEQDHAGGVFQQYIDNQYGAL